MTLHEFAVVAIASETNRPLAIATIVISTVAIIAAIVVAARHREHFDPKSDERLLTTLDTVDWYAHDVGDDLLDASDADREAALKPTGDRIESAHSVLLQVGQLDDSDIWSRLLIALTSTETSYGQFALGKAQSDEVDQRREELSTELDQARDYIS